MTFEGSPNSLTKYYFTSQKKLQKKPQQNNQKQPPYVLCKKVVLENFAIFSGKRPCRSLF